jgi:ABC-type lipoprotein export system ATPase subunit
MESVVLENLVPVFLEKEKIASSEIWDQQLSFPKGERIQIVAPSGSGKTSLIHFLYGLRKDYEGFLKIDGKELRTFQPIELASIRSSRFSIIFQDLRLFPDHSALENLEIKRLLSPYHSESRIREMAGRLGIESKLPQLARNCSYGEQQRIAIIRALQQPFDSLLMDEPFSHLDEKNRQVAMKLIEEEATLRGAAIIFADLKPIEYFKADRILSL